MNTHKKRPQALQSPHTAKPDLSNMIKFIEDVCKGIVYNDDEQIVQITAYKRYDLEPRTEFEIYEKKNEATGQQDC